MNTPTRVGAFAAALVVIFGGAAAVGNAVGPIGTGAGDTSHSTEHGR
ncbi:hypothetical protein [Aeromicrobium sp.]